MHRADVARVGKVLESLWAGGVCGQSGCVGVGVGVGMGVCGVGLSGHTMTPASPVTRTSSCSAISALAFWLSLGCCMSLSWVVGCCTSESVDVEAMLLLPVGGPAWPDASRPGRIPARPCPARPCPARPDASRRVPARPRFLFLSVPARPGPARPGASRPGPDFFFCPARPGPARPRPFLFFCPARPGPAPALSFFCPARPGPVRPRPFLFFAPATALQGGGW